MGRTHLTCQLGSIECRDPSRSRRSAYFAGSRGTQTVHGSHVSSTHPRLHRRVTTPAFRRTVSTLAGERLSRVPRGYPADHPAAHYLQFKQFLAGREFDAEFATSRVFYRELVATFRAV